MATNHQNTAISKEVIATAENAINEVLKILALYATPLTAEDRHNILKMGPKTFEFVELSHTLAKQNPQLLSKSFDMEGFSNKWSDAHNLLGLGTMAHQFFEIIDDIRMMAGSAALHHALEVYADTSPRRQGMFRKPARSTNGLGKSTQIRAANTGHEK